jgi:hypothetical protein
MIGFSRVKASTQFTGSGFEVLRFGELGLWLSASGLGFAIEIIFPNTSKKGAVICKHIACKDTRTSERENTHGTPVLSWALLLGIFGI